MLLQKENIALIVTRNIIAQHGDIKLIMIYYPYIKQQLFIIDDGEREYESQNLLGAMEVYNKKIKKSQKGNNNA